jgi:hypothetical protein
MIERRARDRGADAATRRRLWKLFGAAVLATAGVFWLIHASGILRRG